MFILEVYYIVHVYSIIYRYGTIHAYDGDDDLYLGDSLFMNNY